MFMIIKKQNIKLKCILKAVATAVVAVVASTAVTAAATASSLVLVMGGGVSFSISIRNSASFFFPLWISTENGPRRTNGHHNLEMDLQNFEVWYMAIATYFSKK
uniref:Uncharacterized protein n=1 Tax=Glossina brevipalpis TaxID=37001 RepID=A0A1A9WVJ8_9MUSC